MASSGKVIRLELRGAHRAFSNLRNSAQRNVLMAYRFGQIMDELHKNGFTWEELGAEFNRKKGMPKLYAKLYNTYDTEKDVLEAAEILDTTNVAKLAGHTPIARIQYVFHCLDCNSFNVKKERKHDEEQKPAPVVNDVAPVHFQSAG